MVAYHKLLFGSMRSSLPSPLRSRSEPIGTSRTPTCFVSRCPHRRSHPVYLVDAPTPCIWSTLSPRVSGRRNFPTLCKWTVVSQCRALTPHIPYYLPGGYSSMTIVPSQPPHQTYTLKALVPTSHTPSARNPLCPLSLDTTKPAEALCADSLGV
jgi:hypothetical protein